MGLAAADLGLADEAELALDHRHQPLPGEALALLGTVPDVDDLEALQPTRSRASSYWAAVMPRQVRRMTAAMLRLRPSRLPSSCQAGETKESRQPVPLPGPPGT